MMRHFEKFVPRDLCFSLSLLVLFFAHQSNIQGFKLANGLNAGECSTGRRRFKDNNAIFTAAIDLDQRS